jgi:transcriptional regulator with XRE-family HTH domain
MTERIAFGQRLRRERERRGIRLETIAQSTKIKASLLDALERGDLSHWPGGIFGRGFLRAYLTAIGLPTEPSVAEFQQFYATAPGAARADARESDGLRLTLEPDPDRIPALAGRVAAAVVELVAVAAAAALLWKVTGIGFWMAATIVTSAGSAFATVWLGRSPLVWLANRQSNANAPEAFVDSLPDDDGDLKLTLARD